METIGERTRREAMSRGAALLAATIIASALTPTMINPPENSNTGEFSVYLVAYDGAPPPPPQHGSSAVDRGLEYDFYRQSCPQAELTVRFAMTRIYSQYRDIHPALLRLFFHDCFVKGCDASILLDDSNGNASRSIEKDAIPNRSLRGLDVIEMIKEELESACPGVVSCADTLALATRDGIVMAGGPFYPVFTGRKDSTESYYAEAMAEIPSPFNNITQTLDSFARRGFDEKETVALLGGHHIGKIHCDFINSRLYNFSGTAHPDPSIAPDFLNQLRLSCQDRNNNNPISSGSYFDGHYYRNLIKGRGLLFADQQLMANDTTARLVRDYAADDHQGMVNFRRDFAAAMVKMSNLNVLTGAQGQIRTECSSSLAAL